MSSNHLTLGIQVSYQGQVHDFKTSIDLDAHLAAQRALPDFHDLVVRSNQIDTYSYLFEAIEIEPVTILNAQGRAADFVADGQFDAVGFIEDWHANNALPDLQALAKHLLEVSDLEHHPQLKQALVLAFKQGFKNAQS